MRTGKIATVIGLTTAAILTVICTPLGYYAIRGYGTWARYFEVARQSSHLGDVVLVVLLLLPIILLLKRKAAGEWLETLLTKPPLLDLMYILSVAYTIVRSPRRNTKEFVHRVRLHQTTPLSTRHVSEDRRLPLQQFVCALTNTTEELIQYPLKDTSISRLRGVCLYNIVRRLKPIVAVETGAAGGRTSWYMLLALKENNKGTLISTDLPDYKPEYYRESKGSPVGHLIPKALRDRWELILEDSRTSLPKVAEAYEIDLFVHDSLHTYAHMMFEFETVWSHIVSGGILLAHDADRAFVDFAEKVGRPYWIWERYGGIVR